MEDGFVRWEMGPSDKFNASFLVCQHNWPADGFWARHILA